ncbi:hypothetical protein A2125_01000 [Candidatus Woesebacteria bacterium GWB1_43_5]|uniref:Type 4 fimbrial biogenesis protein PilX N-terminal domain-containing protein n=1 Tax=Candidatus Woesebacteria bacterium GWB1_43_5 TaxID=1802474 RepID=A0A1F7WSS5_9BACT|nr:MAG: hypothetical protein A2125_01000 [Candidatus Woesebacteria bacterium GWB1_43_5]
MVTLIFFVLIATIYISAAVIILSVNSLAATTTELGFSASRVAEGALEDTLLRLIRNPNYAGGAFDLDSGSVTVNVVGSTTKDISVSVLDGNYLRKFEAQVAFNQTEMTITSWKEVF